MKKFHLSEHFSLSDRQVSEKFYLSKQFHNIMCLCVREKLPEEQTKYKSWPTTSKKKSSVYVSESSFSAKFFWSKFFWNSVKSFLAFLENCCSQYKSFYFKLPNFELNFFSEMLIWKQTELLVFGQNFNISQASKSTIFPSSTDIKLLHSVYPDVQYKKHACKYNNPCLSCNKALVI